MKTYILPSLKLTAVLIILCAGIYPLLLAAVGRLSSGNGNGDTVMKNGQVVGYRNIGQKFTGDNYFQGRPSAVGYNAAGSGGSNKGASNADYLALVKARVDTFHVHNPSVKKERIPADLVTASGSGLDPDISVQAAKIQVPRVAKMNQLKEEELYHLIDRLTEKPFLGSFGPEKINVLKLNIELENLQTKQPL